MSVADAWDPRQYERFKSERERPGWDLIDLLDKRDGMKVVDLGCGTGELTRRLHDAVSASHTLGIDSSEAMLEKARTFSGDGVRFERRDISDFADEDAWDVVFSNAAIHWLDPQEPVFRAAFRALKPGGQLAIQMPNNQEHPSHAAAWQAAREVPFAEYLQGPRPQGGMLTLEEYSQLLHRIGFAEQHVRAQIYAHLLPSREDVIEWTKGALLTEYRRKLPGDVYNLFLERYRELLLEQLPDQRPFLFTFRRVLIWARRALSA